MEREIAQGGTVIACRSGMLDTLERLFGGRVVEPGVLHPQVAVGYAPVLGIQRSLAEVFLGASGEISGAKWRCRRCGGCCRHDRDGGSWSSEEHSTTWLGHSDC